MDEQRDVYVVGAGVSKFAADRVDGTIRDWVAEAVLAALEDAGVDGVGAVDHGITSYESDHFANQIALGAILHDAIGLCPKPNVRIEGGGATGALALRAAFAHIRSGLCDSVLVYGAERNGRGVPSTVAVQLLSLSSDADWEMLVGGTYTAYYAAMIREHMRRYGTTEAQCARVAVKNRRNAALNPYAQAPMPDITVERVLASPPIALPYKLLDCSLLSDGAAAMLLATAQWAAEHSRLWQSRPRVRFAGTGCGTDFMRIGDRPEPYPGIAHFRGKRRAAASAYAMAGIGDPLHDIDVAEVYDSYSGAELQAYEDLGFVPYGQGGPAAEAGLFDLDGELPVNASGGLLGFGAPAGATGIAQATEIFRQLQGRADSPQRQVPNARRGLTDTHGGACTISVVNIFERMD
jgi:acetyl-CoA C-acetyltransferase